MSKVYDESENLIEVYEDGELVKEFRPLDSSKISKETKEKLKDALKGNGYQDFQELVLEILTGKTVKEIEDSG